LDRNALPPAEAVAVLEQAHGEQFVPELGQEGEQQVAVGRVVLVRQLPVVDQADVAANRTHGDGGHDEQGDEGPQDGDHVHQGMYSEVLWWRVGECTPRRISSSYPASRRVVIGSSSSPNI